eukprot:Nk52_evm3s157 gene=Nk52_evmTU3s157
MEIDKFKDMTVDEFFVQMNRSHPQFAEQLAKMQDFESRKLYHQLSLVLKEFTVALTSSARRGDEACSTMYSKFVSKIRFKMNPITLIEVCILLVDKTDNAEKAIKFMEYISKELERSKPAYILAQMKLADILLGKKDFEACKGIMEEIEKEIETSRVELPLAIHSAYYIVSAEYFKLQGNFTSFYNDALKYLACADLDTLAPARRVQCAFDLGLAAVLSSDIYNFGELVVHPILDSLKGTEHDWLNEFLRAFNSGDISTFTRLKAKWSTQNDLKANSNALVEKIRLLALIQLVFSRPADDRRLSFEIISKHVQVPVNDVEVLVMKALSLKLIKGIMDQVKQEVLVKWVRPRVMDKEQIVLIKDNLKNWCTKVSTTQAFIEENTPDFIGH